MWMACTRTHTHKQSEELAGSINSIMPTENDCNGTANKFPGQFIYNVLKIHSEEGQRRINVDERCQTQSHNEIRQENISC